MRLLSLELRNFKPFRDIVIPEEGVFPEGLILVSGPNSTGKSSLFEAVLWALWGPEAIELTNDEIVSFSSSFCNVILKFDVDGVAYKIDRSYDSANGMRVILYTRKGKDWKKIVDKSASVKKSIEEILGIQWAQAKHTLLVRQGEVALIANATPSVLRDLLVRVYNIELLEKMGEQVEHFEADLGARLKSLTDQYEPPERVQQQIEDAKRRMNDGETELSDKREQLNKNRESLSRLPDQDLLVRLQNLSSDTEDTRRGHEQALLELRRALKYAGILEYEERVVRARREYLSKEKERLKTATATSELRKTEIDHELGSISGISKDLEGKIHTLDSVDMKSTSGTVNCPTCSKPLTGDERSRIINEYREQLKVGRTNRERLTRERSSLETNLREGQDQEKLTTEALNALSQVEERERIADEARAEHEKQSKILESELGRLGHSSLQSLLQAYGARDLSALVLIHDSLSRDSKNLEADLVRIQGRLATESDTISMLESKKVKMKDIGAQVETIKNLDTHAKFVRRNLVRAFVADWVFQKRLIGIIRGATNQYVTAFTGGQYTSVDLEPTPAKGTSGPGVILKINDQRDDAVKKTSQLSYGDRTAISLALRLGISRTMSGVRPFKGSPAVSPKVRCVLLDEPLGGLDRSRRSAVIRNLVNDQSFKQIFLITHTEVEGGENVPVIDVSKVGNTSIATLHLSSED